MYAELQLPQSLPLPLPLPLTFIAAVIAKWSLNGSGLSCVGTVGQPRGVAVLIAFQRTLLNCDSERVPESNWLIIKHETVTEATLREADERGREIF